MHTCEMSQNEPLMTSIKLCTSHERLDFLHRTNKRPSVSASAVQNNVEDLNISSWLVNGHLISMKHYWSFARYHQTHQCEYRAENGTLRAATTDLHPEPAQD